MQIVQAAVSSLGLGAHQTAPEALRAVTEVLRVLQRACMRVPQWSAQLPCMGLMSHATQ